ncbi:MAG: DNA-binding response regulator [Puniceicoccaceae bacterium]|nr:MAG: DNA-binding response regulator [Puniceicoccaceae bacterium]
MKARILIAEDEAPLRLGLVDALEGEGFEVVAAGDGRQALALFPRQAVDCVILDIMMPGINGYDVCAEIRRRDRAVPVLFLSAKSAEIDKVLGLRLGADDYLAKPFGLPELIARIEALLRRARLAREAVADHGTEALPEVFAFGAVTIERKRFQAVRGDGLRLDLTPREMGLIEVFARRPGEVLTRDALLNAVWGVDYFGTTRTLDQHVAQVRKKTEFEPDRPAHLLTVHGVGYRYEP